MSDPAYFDKVVDVEKVDEVIDHHPGFEQHWQDRIGDKFQGSVAIADRL